MIGSVDDVGYREGTKTTNCPLCGRTMGLVNDLAHFTVQFCRIHGVFLVDKPTDDVWILDGFDVEMAPIRRKWYEVENHKPLTLERYREMVKWANLRRLEGRPIGRPKDGAQPLSEDEP